MPKVLIYFVYRVIPEIIDVLFLAGLGWMIGLMIGVLIFGV